MLIFEDLREPIVKIATEVMETFDPNDLEIDRKSHGDFSLKLFRYRSADDFSRKAEELRDRISDLKFVSSTTLVGAYLNITIKPGYMLSLLDNSITEKGKYPDTFQDSERVLVEHTSTNPTGPLHIGRCRNSIIGDSLARLLRRYGYRVSTQYYVNDTGKQVAGLYLGYLDSGKKDKTINGLLKGYRTVYKEIKNNPEKEREIESLIKAYESQDPTVTAEIREVCTVMLQGIIKSLDQVGIKVDDYVWESGFLHSEEMASVMQDLQDYVKDEDGATYVETEPDSKVFLTRKAHGTTLYALRDLAYHTFKSKNYDWLIDVLGEDHKKYARDLKIILTDMLELRSTLDYVFYGFISLESGKMSTRSGNVVTLDDLVQKVKEASLEIVKEKRPDLGPASLKSIADAVAISSIRFQIVKINPDKPMVFRFSEALNFEGDSAPYIMYSYARASKILQRTVEKTEPTLGEFIEQEHALLRSLYSYPYVLENCKNALRTDLLSSYVLNLVKLFNEFYNKCQVIGSGVHEIKRIKIVEVYRNILEDACSILGLEILEEM